eukprot:scaffold12967_cov36-Cyclotella_meneghiniana.AAC.2
MDITASLSTSDFNLPEADAQATNISQETDAAETARRAEIARLQAELEQLRRQQAEEAERTQQQAQNNPRADPEGVAFLTYLNQSQVLMQQQQTAFLNIIQQMQNAPTPAAPATAPAAAITKPNVDFPSWDGQPSTKQDFLFRINTMKKDRFFSTVTVTDWTRKLPGFEDQSQYLLNAIVEKVPLQHRSIFTNDATVADDRFAMLHRLVDKLKGDHIENQLLAISDLATLEFKADDTSATYMARVRGLQEALQGVTIDRFLTLLTLSRLDQGLYPGVMSLFRQANAALLADSLSGIELRLEKEDRLRTLEGVSAESARRAKTSKPPGANPKPDASSIVYPPLDKQINWSLIKEYTKDTTNCPGCFATNRSGERCRKGYCFPFLTAGFLLQYNPDEANKQIQDIKDKKQDRKPRGRGRRATDKDDAALLKETPAPPPVADPAPPKEVIGSGKRATSVDNKVPASYSEVAEKQPPAKQNYYDQLESDSDNDIGLFVPYDSDNFKSATS